MHLWEYTKIIHHGNDLYQIAKYLEKDEDVESVTQRIGEDSIIRLAINESDATTCDKIYVKLKDYKYEIEITDNLDIGEVESINQIKVIDELKAGLYNNETGEFTPWEDLEITMNGDEWTSVGIELVGSLVIPESVSSIRYPLKNQKKLTNIKFPSTFSNSAFRFISGCVSLKSVSWAEGSETIVGDFSECTSLNNIKFPSSTKVINAKFSGCTNLKSVELPSKITEIGDYAFRRCSEIESVSISTSVTKIGKECFYRLHGYKVINYS